MGEFTMKQAMQEFLNSSRLKGDIQAMQIDEIWKDLMGVTIAKYTDKIQIFGKKLIIKTTAAPLKQELLYQREKIIQRINERFGNKIIEEVIIQ